MKSVSTFLPDGHLRDASSDSFIFVGVFFSMKQALLVGSSLSSRWVIDSGLWNHYKAF